MADSTQEKDNTVTIALVQARMARAALGWGVRDLAAAANLGTNTVARFERGEAVGPRTLAALRTAFEAAGILFIPENGGGPGVRLSSPPKR